MNNSATAFRIAKMEQQMSEMIEKLDYQNKTLADFMKLLAPLFAQPENDNINNEMLFEASQQGNT